MNWEQALAGYRDDSTGLFSTSFLERWGKEEWKPSQDDKTAAAMLHTQINSRITTQRLGYLEGVEKLKQPGISTTGFRLPGTSTPWHGRC
jgi:hypothetical protein